jgi:hypothetical protein
VQVLTITPLLCNPELDYSKLVSIFSKLSLQSGCNLPDIGFLIPEKVDDHSLIILDPKRTGHGFSDPDCEDHFVKATQSNLI